MKGYQRSLLIDESPLQVLPKLAKAIGLNEAIIVQQIHYWLNRSANHKDGVPFVYKTAQEWMEEFPFWSEATIKRALLELRNRGLIDVRKKSEGSWDRTNWYSIHYDALNSLNLGIESICAVASDQIDTMDRSNLTSSNGSDCTDRSGQSDPISNTTETTSKTTSKPLCPLSADVFDLAVKAYPKRAGNDPLRKATIAWNARIREGVPAELMLAGAQRYARFCEATGKVGTETVLMRATFFGPDKPFDQGWGLPAAPASAPSAPAAIPCGHCSQPLTAGWTQSPKGRVCNPCHRGYMDAGTWPVLTPKPAKSAEQGHAA